eukprot:TRINITY_DN13310_c0_g1_i4.p3 TRINITY_DN13310_c0_g1~~TRINITY_DN13310_c0_g1_i4.p3  ORF type:complete len:225 (+),score=52.09 TRINITY_DN13310_c0_g1_i4:1177-1851(+)
MIEGLEEITEEQGFFPTESRREFSLHRELSFEELEEGNLNEFKGHGFNKIKNITTIHSPNPAMELSNPITSQHSRRQMLRVNLAEELDDCSLEAEDESLSETRKFDLPAFEKTLKNKELISLNPTNRQAISDVHHSLPDNEASTDIQRISINIPKSFEKNMKQTHRVYLKEENKRVQGMKKKNLQIEIPETPKEKAATQKPKESALKKESMSKKITNDVEIDIF